MLSCILEVTNRAVNDSTSWIKYAIQKTLVAAGAMAKFGGAETLQLLGKDNALCEQAAELIFKQLVRDIVDRREPTLPEFVELIEQLADLAHKQ